MKYTTLYIIGLCLLCKASNAQQKINGQVINIISGEPVPNATIKSLHGKKATSTESNGVFVILAKLPDTLVISSIGYETNHVAVTEYKQFQLLKFKLKPVSNELQEVIVSTGYELLPKERATGSFTALSNAKLNEQVSTDILSRLESITSGLTFDRSTRATPQIQIRGLSTINGPKAPLIVVDNFPYEGDITNINPNDVESITVLKDAATASIWGTRAGNGVIVITTKKAKYNQPISVDLNGNFTLGMKPDLSYPNQMTSGDFIDAERILFNKGYYNRNITSAAHPYLTPVVELLAAERAGTISQASAESQINEMRGQDVRNDFNRYFYQRSKNQQYSVTLKSGTDKQSWLFSSGFDKNLSDLNAGYDRINLRFQDNYRPVKNLEIGTSLYYTKSTTSSGKPGYGDITSHNGFLYPYAKFADANSNALPIPKDYSLSYLESLSGQPLLDWKYYPLNDYLQNSTKTNLQDINANFNAAYQLFPFLKLNVQYQYERQDSHTDNLMGVESYYVRNLVNQFTQVDASGKTSYPVPVGGILNLSDNLIESQNVRGQLNFNKSWSKNEITAIAGAELRQINATGNTNAFYGYDPSILTFGNADLSNPYPTYVTGSPAYIPDTKNLNKTSNRYVSVFANAAYTYDGKYTLSVSGRRDASNLFGVNFQNKWNPLGSAGLSWEVSREKFYNAGFLPYLRIRATYGASGNVDLSQTAVTTISYLGNSPYTQTPYAVYNTYANADLKWETTAMLNLAADFRAFNGRISGTIEYYHKKGTGLFAPTPIDYTSGETYVITKNVAAMSGNGTDITINSVNTKGKFRWLTTLNFSFYKDKVTSYYLNDQFGSDFVGNHTVSALVGKPVYSILSFKTAGLDPLNGNPRGYVNGQISEDYNTLYYNTPVSDMKYSGSALPTKFGSFANTFSYKNLSLVINATFNLGYYFRKSTINYAALLRNGQGNSDYALRWQKPGDEQHTSVPSFIYPDNSTRDAFYVASESLVDKADNIRLQYITLSYDFNHSTFHKLPFKSLQVYSNVNNLGIIWRANKDHIDPDYYYNSNTLKAPLTISFGLRSSF